MVSSQLDMDRMDYLNRDSFYSGVQEGIVGAERIINMLDVVNDKLVVECKGIYSIEKFHSKAFNVLASLLSQDSSECRTNAH